MGTENNFDSNSVNITLSPRIWQGGKVYGLGIQNLLINIKKTGSLQNACAELSISYSKAWKSLRSVEKFLGYPLLKRYVGGESGGRSTLTPEALIWIDFYENLCTQIQDFSDDYLAKSFPPELSAKNMD